MKKCTSVLQTCIFLKEVGRFPEQRAAAEQGGPASSSLARSMEKRGMSHSQI